VAPLFHHGDDPPSLYQLGPQLDQLVQSTAAIPVEQFAAQLMTKYFTTDWPVASQITDMVAVNTICWDLLPDNSGEHAGEPMPDAWFTLQDLVTEAVQLMRTSGLVMERSYKVAQNTMTPQWLTGLVTTRRGRAALADGSAAQILASVYARHA
jgi:hypothetical protein